MTTRCEDFPCCGHEPGDCNGELYGSDASIASDPHLYCDHNTGYCKVWDDEDSSRRAEAEVLPYEGTRKLNLGPVESYFDSKGGIKHILILTPERVRILEDAIHEYHLHENDQDGPDLLTETEADEDEAEIREAELAQYDAFDWDEEYYNYADN